MRNGLLQLLPNRLSFFHFLLSMRSLHSQIVQLHQVGIVILHEVQAGVIEGCQDGDWSELPDELEAQGGGQFARHDAFEALQDILRPVQHGRQLIQYSRVYIRLAMTETERYMGESLKPIFQQRFIKTRFLGCFTHYVFVVIKKRTLLVYSDEDSYKQCPQHPQMFFNLSFLICTLDKNRLRLANNYAEMSLTHDQPARMVDLMEAIQNGRNMIGPASLYPKKFVYLDTLNSHSSKASL